MHSITRVTVMALWFGVTSCSQQTPGSNATPSTPTSAAPVASIAASSAVSAAPTDNPCNLLTGAEVRAVFPKASSGQHKTDGLEYGLDRCAWETPTGQIGIEVSKIEASAFENELRGDLTGFVDPRITGAVDRIRFESVPGIGDHAIAVLEKADTKRGINVDVALLAIQRGHRMVVLMTHDASRDAPLPTLESLEDLGRKLASRLQP